MCIKVSQGPIRFFRAIIPGHVEDWIRKKGLNKETKRKLEHVTAKGKKIEWMIECWKMEMHEAKNVVRLRALLNDVVEIKVKKVKYNSGNILIIIDGFLESHFHDMWYSYRPGWFFVRALFDRFIYKFWTERYDERVRKLCYDLHKELEEHFKSYREIHL